MRAAPVGTKNKKRIALGFLIVAVLLLLLTFRVAYWQIIKGEWLTEKAIAQQTQDTPIEAKRGAIYDRNGKELATSITCYTLWARPAQVKMQKGKTITAEQIAAIASQIAQITGRDAETVQTNLTKSTALVRIASNLDKETADAVRALKLNGLELAEGTKRYYPLGNFASELFSSVSAEASSWNMTSILQAYPADGKRTPICSATSWSRARRNITRRRTATMSC